MDAHGQDARRVVGHLFAWRRQRLGHFTQNVHAAFARLLECGLHDLTGDAGHLDVHLQRGHAAGGTGNLEVHVTQMILVTEDVRQHRKTAAVGDQAHGDTGHRFLHGYTGVHQRQAATTDGGHGTRTVRFGDFRHHAQRVRERALGRQHRRQGPLGQATVTDLAALGGTHAARFADAVRREVVMQQKVVSVLAFERVDHLRVALGAQRGHHQRLGFTAREQRRTMGTRQHAGTDADRPYLAGGTAVDARLGVQDTSAYDAFFHRREQRLHFLRPLAVFTGQVRHALANLGNRLLARLLVRDGIGVLERLFRHRHHGGLERLVLLGRHPRPRLDTGFLRHLADRLQHRLERLLAEQHTIEHDRLGQHAGLGLDHDDACRRTRDHQIQIGLGGFLVAGVQHEGTVLVADAGRTDRPLERHTRQHQRRRCTDHGRNVRIHLVVGRQHGRHHLHFVVEPLREQRPHGAIDQARGKDRLLGGTRLTLEEAAGNAARGVGTLDEIDRQREEILSRLHTLAGGNRHQHHGVAHTDHHRVCLFGDLPRFQAQRVPTERNFFTDQFHVAFFLCFGTFDPPARRWRTGGLPQRRRPRRSTSAR